MKLNDAKAIYFGNTPVKKVFLGDELIYPEKQPEPSGEAELPENYVFYDKPVMLEHSGTANEQISWVQLDMELVPKENMKIVAELVKYNKELDNYYPDFTQQAETSYRYASGHYRLSLFSGTNTEEQAVYWGVLGTWVYCGVPGKSNQSTADKPMPNNVKHTVTLTRDRFTVHYHDPAFEKDDIDVTFAATDEIKDFVSLSNNPQVLGGKLIMYSFRIYEGEKLVCDLVPIAYKTNPDYPVRLFDKVGGGLYENYTSSKNNRAWFDVAPEHFSDL